MPGKLIEYSEIFLQWLLPHGVRIIIIEAGSLVLSAVLSRIVIRAKRVAVVSDRKRLKLAFDSEGIEIPQRVILTGNSEKHG